MAAPWLCCDPISPEGARASSAVQPFRVPSAGAAPWLSRNPCPSAPWERTKEAQPEAQEYTSCSPRVHTHAHTHPAPRMPHLDAHKSVKVIGPSEAPLPRSPAWSRQERSSCAITVLGSKGVGISATVPALGADGPARGQNIRPLEDGVVHAGEVARGPVICGATEEKPGLTPPPPSPVPVLPSCLPRVPHSGPSPLCTHCSLGPLAHQPDDCRAQIPLPASALQPGSVSSNTSLAPCLSWAKSSASCHHPQDRCQPPEHGA